jgi:hypothetical protein
VVFAGIGALEYLNIWQYIQKGLETVLVWLNIDPASGSVAILAGGTPAMAQLRAVLENDPNAVPAAWVVGAFIMATSAPLQNVFGQIPNVWKGITDLNEKECIIAGCIGIFMRLLTAGIFGRLLVFLW